MSGRSTAPSRVRDKISKQPQRELGGGGVLGFFPSKRGSWPKSAVYHKPTKNEMGNVFDLPFFEDPQSPRGSGPKFDRVEEPQEKKAPPPADETHVRNKWWFFVFFSHQHHKRRRAPPPTPFFFPPDSPPQTVSRRQFFWQEKTPPPPRVGQIKWPCGPPTKTLPSFCFCPTDGTGKPGPEFRPPVPAPPIPAQNPPTGEVFTGGPPFSVLEFWFFCSPETITKRLRPKATRLQERPPTRAPFPP